MYGNNFFTLWKGSLQGKCNQLQKQTASGITQIRLDLEVSGSGFVMSTKACFNRKQAIEAGIKFTDGQSLDFGHVVILDYGEGTEDIIVDFNSWGPTRTIIKPWLEAHNIKFREI